jgi:hypothetical protein
VDSEPQLWTAMVSSIEEQTVFAGTKDAHKLLSVIVSGEVFSIIMFEIS